MTYDFLSMLTMTFISLLWISILGDVHAGQLVRRSLNNNNDPNSEFILKTHFVLNDYAPIYHSNGQVAFTVKKHDFPVGSKGSEEGYIVVDAVTNKTLLELHTRDDYCLQTSHFEDPSGIAKFKINPRGAEVDRWHFSLKAFPNTSFVFRRDVLSIEGPIINEKTDKTVASLSLKLREKSWFKSLFHRKKFYVLKTDGTVPAYDLVALMVLVQMRSDLCGL